MLLILRVITQRENHLSSFSYASIGHHVSDWVKPKPGAGNFIWVSQMCSKDPSMWTSFCCLTWYNRRELDWKQIKLTIMRCWWPRHLNSDPSFCCCCLFVCCVYIFLRKIWLFFLLQCSIVFQKNSPFPSALLHFY